METIFRRVFIYENGEVKRQRQTDERNKGKILKQQEQRSETRMSIVPRVTYSTK